MDNEAVKNSNMSGQGYLVVRVSTASGAIPIEKATVTVRGGEESNSDYYRSFYSGASGLTEKIALPAPLRSLSEDPSNGGVRPFALYSVDVFSDGYVDLSFVNVPVFDTITSIQPANMIPRPDNEYSDSFAPYDPKVIEGENTEL